MTTYYKTALTAISLFVTISVNSQNQQETLAWLSQKLTAYAKPHGGVYGGVGFTNLKVTSVDPCAVTITFEQKNLMRNKLFCTMTVVLPTEGISISDRGVIQYRDEVIQYTTVSAAPNVPSKTKMLSTTPDIFITDEERGIMTKIQQAMHQAATFCTAKN